MLRPTSSETIAQLMLIPVARGNVATTVNKVAEVAEDRTIDCATRDSRIESDLMRPAPAVAWTAYRCDANIVSELRLAVRGTCRIGQP